MRRPSHLLAILMSFVLALAVGIGVNPTAAQAAPSALSMTVTDPYPGQVKPFSGQAVTISGDLGVAAERAVVLQKYSSKKWKTSVSGKTDADGQFSFQASTTSSSTKYRVYAAKSSGMSSVTTAEVKVETQSDSVTIGVMRLGNQLLVSGSASPVIEGRAFKLQVKSGSSWKDVATATETADRKSVV